MRRRNAILPLFFHAEEGKEVSKAKDNTIVSLLAFSLVPTTLCSQLTYISITKQLVSPRNDSIVKYYYRLSSFKSSLKRTTRRTRFTAADRNCALCLDNMRFLKALFSPHYRLLNTSWIFGERLSLVLIKSTSYRDALWQIAYIRCRSCMHCNAGFLKSINFLTGCFD